MFSTRVQIKGARIGFADTTPIVKNKRNKITIATMYSGIEKRIPVSRNLTEDRDNVNATNACAAQNALIRICPTIDSDNIVFTFFFILIPIPKFLVSILLYTDVTVEKCTLLFQWLQYRLLRLPVIQQTHISHILPQFLTTH